MTNVLLFGASGFIGRHVRAALAADPRISTVSIVGRSAHDLVHGDPAGLAELVRAIRPGAVVTCVGRLSGTGYEMMAANTLTTAALIDAIATAAPGTRLVRLGSAAEYGPVPAGRPVTEDTPAAPLNGYGLSHLAATRLVEFASADGRVDGIVLRAFNVIGPGMSSEHLLGRAALLLGRAVDRGEENVRLGPLDAYRDFVDVRDVARAVLAAVLLPGPPAARLFNVASGSAVCSRTAVALLATAAGFTGDIREASWSGSGSSRSAAVPWMQGDIGRAGQVLGWRPEHQLADSMKALVHGRSDDC